MNRTLQAPVTGVASVDDPALLGALRALAEDHGMAAALRRALDGLPVAALVPFTATGGAFPVPAPGTLVRLVRFPEDPDAVAAPALAGTYDLLLRRLLHARLGVSRSALAATVEHLAARRSGADPLLSRQLVRGALADVRSGLYAVESATAGTHAPSRDVLVDLHLRLTDLDATTTSLLGAHGFVTGSPGHALLVSERVADHWSPRGPVTV